MQSLVWDYRRRSVIWSDAEARTVSCVAYVGSRGARPCVIARIFWCVIVATRRHHQAIPLVDRNPGELFKDNILIIHNFCSELVISPRLPRHGPQRLWGYTL